MALVIYWYDFICFGIIAAAIIGALWVLWKREYAGKCGEGTKYESLLLTRSDDADAFICPTPVGHVGAQQLWVSCWRGLHPGWLMLLRLTSGVIMALLLVWDIRKYDGTIFVYYTEWTFTLVIVYFALATVISAHGCWLYSKEQFIKDEEGEGILETNLEESRSAATTFRKHGIWGAIKLQSHYEEEESAQRAGLWGYLMLVSFQACAGAVVLTDVIFWCLIVPFLSNTHFSLNMLMGCMHTVNAAFLLLDTAINSLPFPWFRLSYFVLWSCLYVIFQWVLHACGFSWWPYPFLELAIPWAPLWYFCLAVIHIPCYGIYYLIVKAKYAVFPKLFPHAFIRSC